MTTTTIEIVREHSKTSREVWVFVILDFPTVLLERHEHHERESIRHRKWTCRPGNYYRLARVRPPEPDVPADVLAEAIEGLAARLKFRKWSDR